jgi:hypothetical protein
LLLTGIKEISTKDYGEMIRFHMRTQGALIVFGLGGTGKTEIAKAAVMEATGREPVYVNLSVMEAPDLLGLPYRDERTNSARYSPPPFMPLKERTAEPVVMLFDEIDKAKPELQNPLLEIFQFHTLNGEPLNVRSIIATANLPDEGAFSKPISGPLANRCALYKTHVVFDEWQDWAKSSGIHPLIVGYLAKNSEKLSMSPDKNDRTAYARPSPRSWTMAARDLSAFTAESSVDSEGAVEFMTRLVAGRVGEPEALSFRVWLEHYRHIEQYVDALLDHGTMPPTALTIDRVLVLGLAICGDVAKGYNDPKKASSEGQKLRTQRAFKWLKTLPSETQIGAVKSTMTTQMFIKHELMKISEVKDVFAQIAGILGMRKESA